jgi:hypothetical protein
VEAQVHPLSTRWPKSAAVLAVLALGACAPDQTVSSTPEVQDFASAARNTVDYSSVTLSGEVSLKVGTSTKLSVRTSSRSRGSIKWQSTNPGAATVNSQGNVTGQSVGSAYVTASGFAVNETYLVSVTPAYTLTGFTVSPTTGTALAPGQTRQFSTQQLWSDGQARNFGVTYTATGGSISSSGLFTAGSVAGSFMVIANCLCGALDTAFVTVEVPAQLTKITVSPKTVSLNAGATQQFGATANWSTGATTLPPITWSATGGSISTGGLYTAPTTAGTYRVIVAHSGGTLRDTATVTVATPPTDGGGTTPPPTAGLFFADNFDNGLRTNANGFKWTDPAYVSVSNERAYSGNYALKFEYGAAGFGEDGWSEQRFDMGRYVSDVTIEYRLFVPANFKHRLDDRATNNKLLMLWRDKYGSLTGTWQIGWEYLRGTDDLTSKARFMSSRWDCEYVTDGCEWPNPEPQSGFPIIGGTNGLRIGEWNKVRFRAKSASSGTSQDGVATLWINDVMVFTYSLGRFHNSDKSVTDAVLRNGYLMGWANSGFTERTVFYVDDVKFYAN